MSPSTLQKIHVCLVANNNYAQHTAVTIASLLKNLTPNLSISIYLVYNDLSATHRSRILTLKHLHEKATIELVWISAKKYSHLPLYNAHHSLEVYFRLSLANMFPKLDFMLYFDSDLVIKADVSQLWFKYTKQAKMLYAVEEPYLINQSRLKGLGLQKNSPYFNAGVLLLNLKKMRQTRFEERCFAYIRQHRDYIVYQDQDVLNAVSQADWEPLPLSWNAYYFIFLPVFEAKTKFYSQAAFKAARCEPAIIHFNQHPKPWAPYCLDHRKNEYFKYLPLTPYHNYQVGFEFRGYLILKKQLNRLKYRLKYHHPRLYNGVKKIKDIALSRQA